jgi:DNA sulfur modification protein DndB
LEILFCKSKKGVNTAELKRVRSSDEELNTYANLASRFFTLLGKIAPPLEHCMASESPSAEIKKQRHAGGGHILFRPVGILIYTEIVATLMRGESMSLEDAVAELAMLPTELSKPPYAGILWDGSTGTMAVKNRALTRELLLYYLGYLRDASKARKIGERYALLLNDSSAKPPIRQGKNISRLKSRTRQKKDA